MGRTGSLETRIELENEILEKRDLVRRLAEEAVTLSQDLAEAGWECEARHKASSCHAAHHGSPRRSGQQTDQKQNELGTDLAARL